jgi:hypothetical protein
LELAQQLPDRRPVELVLGPAAGELLQWAVNADVRHARIFALPFRLNE